MDIQTLDAAYEQLNQKVTLIWDNLLALPELDYYSSLTESEDWVNSLTANSKEKALGLKAANDQLFTDLGLLQEQLGKFQEKRKELGLLNRSETLEQLEKLIRGRSIIRSSKDIPLEQRSLLTARTEDQMVSCQDLLGYMDTSFARLKASLLDVKELSDRLFLYINSFTSELTSLTAEAAKYGKTSTVPIDVFSNRLEELKEKGRKDLFNLSTAPERDYPLEALLANARRSLEQLARLESQFRQKLARELPATLEKLNKLRVDCLRLNRRLTQEFGLQEREVPSNKDLIDTLDKIQKLSRSKQRSDLSDVITLFENKCRERDQELQALKAEMEAIASRSDQLLSRWVGLKKRAQNTGHGQDNPLGKFAERADEQLKLNNLEGAETWINRYKSRLDELTASR